MARRWSCDSCGKLFWESQMLPTCESIIPNDDIEQLKEYCHKCWNNKCKECENSECKYSGRRTIENTTKESEN